MNGWMKVLAKRLSSSHHLRIESSLGQLLFGTASFLVEELFRIKVLIETGASAQHQESKIPHYPFFLESYLFRAAIFSKDIIFYSSYLFRRSTLPQHTSFRRVTVSQLSFLSIATLRIYQLVIKQTLSVKYQLRTDKVQEFFLLYLLFLRLTSQTKFIYLRAYKKYCGTATF